jgi:hypothetical protein
MEPPPTYGNHEGSAPATSAAAAMWLAISVLPLQQAPRRAQSGQDDRQPPIERGQNERILHFAYAAYVLQPLQSPAPVVRAEFASGFASSSVELPSKGHRCRQNSRRAVNDCASVISTPDG